VNAGLLTLCACLVYRIANAKITGASVACLFPVLGFGLFGKNLLNVWSIVLGVFPYARFKGEAFSAHLNTAFFGAALAPVFSEIERCHLGLVVVDDGCCVAHVAVHGDLLRCGIDVGGDHRPGFHTCHG
jgi:hypothetical protein